VVQLACSPGSTAGRMASRWTLLGGADRWGRASAPALVAEVVAVVAAAVAAAPAAAAVAADAACSLECGLPGPGADIAKLEVETVRWLCLAEKMKRPAVHRLGVPMATVLVEGCEDAGLLLRCTHPIDYSQSVGSSQTAGLPGLVQKASQGCGCDAQELRKWKRVATRRKA